VAHYCSDMICKEMDNKYSNLKPLTYVMCTLFRVHMRWLALALVPAKGSLCLMIVAGDAYMDMHSLKPYHP
jgi:hypothetical protein